MPKIGFDARRAFLNRSGLGNYSREVIRSILEFYPAYKTFLYTPDTSKIFRDVFKEPQVRLKRPKRNRKQRFESTVKPLNPIRAYQWRNIEIVKSIIYGKMDVYHGLSNELPKRVNHFKGAKVVTIHDVVFKEYPRDFPRFDRYTYNKRTLNAIHKADMIVCPSAFTANSLTMHYAVNPKKIEVIHPSIQAAFYQEVPEEISIQRFTNQWGIQKPYILCLGDIRPRKNQKKVVEAMRLLKSLDVQLVLVGRSSGKYIQSIKSFIQQENIDDKVVWLNSVSTHDLPLLFYGAQALVYPSVIEGYGLPIAEAMLCGLPVLTTKNSSMEEIGGSKINYVKANDVQGIADFIQSVVDKPSSFTYKLTPKERWHFSAERQAQELDALYKRLI